MEDNDLRLPRLAEANLHLIVAEEEANKGNFENARVELDKGVAALDELRDDYQGLDPKRQPLLAAMAKPLSQKAKEIETVIPAKRVVSQGKKEEDPEQDIDPGEDD